ncbi:MAG: hypothetical protein ACC631_02840 [Halocynthiibacter sp.]
MSGFTEIYSTSAIFPLLVLAGLGFGVPKVLARALPEGVRPLILLSLLATGLLIMLSALVFLSLYLLQGVPLSALQDGGVSISYFLRLSAMSAPIWAPVMVLTISSLPGKWTEAEW